MLKKIIYGMAKIHKKKYGYGSNIKKKYNSEHFLKYLNNHKKIKHFEISKRYKGSVEALQTFKKKIIHYKIDKISENKNLIKKNIQDEVNKYLKQNNIKKFEILYLHQNYLKIISNPIVLDTLLDIKKSKKTKYIGVSIYNLKEFKYAIKSKIIDVIQIPVNITDSYLYSKIPKKNKKIFVARSIYLQGSLINKISKHPKRKQIEKYKKKIKSICNTSKLEYFKAITSYPFNLKKIDYVIISSIHKNNLDKIIKSVSLIDNQKMKKFYNLSKNYKSWTNPKNW
jgi:aryl-alcohol dehydrogenase-like predicted oxidoreductase